MGVITQEARTWAEQPFPSYEVTVSRTDTQRFAYAVGETDPVYFDAAAARSAGHPDLLAPLYFPLYDPHAECELCRCGRTGARRFGNR